jgi:hypothetical protein
MLHSRAFVARYTAIGALLVVLTAAGCGGEAEPAADASTSSPAAEATAAAVSLAPSPNLDAAVSSEPPPSSETSEDAESAEYEECGDGDCEVSFSGSVEFPIGGTGGEWTVAAVVEADGVDVSLTNPDGMGGGGGLLYEPGCTLAMHADGGGSLSCGEAVEEPEAGGYVMHLLELNGDDAVIHAMMG